MAATPKRSFRRTVASTVEERSPRFLLGSLALAMVISLLAGLAIGIKIGHHDNSNNKANAASVVKPTKTPTTVRRTAKSKRAPLVGSVVSTSPKLLVVEGKTGRASLGLVAKTVVEATTPGTPADIKAGAHVLFVVNPATTSPTTTTATGLTSSSAAAPTPTTRPAPPTAKEIVVVTGSEATRGGAVVASVTANSMTFKLGGQLVVTVLTTGARILKTIPAKPVDLTAGQRVLVRSYLPPAVKKAKKAAAVPRRRIALEIVILPLDTAFS